MPTDATIDDPTDREIIDPETLEPRRKPVADAKEAFDLAERLFKDRKPANENFGEIRLRFDGKPPRDAKKLRDEGMGWCANFSRKSMSTAVQRCVPALIQFLDGLRYLTASRLPDTVAKAQAAQANALPGPAAPAAPSPVPPPTGAPDGNSADADSDTFADPTPIPKPSPQEKSEIFQRALTSLLRGWNGFRPFIYQLATEDTLFGYGVAGCLDDVEWRPQAFTFDQFAVNMDSGHDVNDWEAVAFAKAFAIHELIGFIQDREAAEKAGWNVDNVVEAINASMPDDKRKPDNYSRTLLYADMIRDGNLAQSCRANAKVVECYIVYYREYEGQVSQYIVNRNARGEKDEEELFYAEDRFERTADVVSPFSIQWGNGKYYGSIGLGRELYGLHQARDRNACRIADLAYLNGLLRLPDDKSNANRSAFRLNQLAMYVPTTGDALVKADVFDGNIPVLLEVDTLWSNAIEQLSNAYLPSSSNPGEKTTATEILDDARKENMLTGDRLARFYGQFCALIEMVQRRVCSKENIKAAKDVLDAEKSGKTLLAPDEYEFLRDTHDEGELDQYEEHELPGHLDRDAVLMNVDLLREGLTPLDIYRISRAPANEPMGDTPATMQQKLQQAYPVFQANPAIDQYKFLKLVLSATLSPQIAEEILLPVNNSGVQALAQAQKQLIELGTMVATGQQVPVLPDDDDPAHRGALKTLFAQAPQDPAQIAANPPAHNALTLGLAHYNAHLAAGKQKGEKGEAFEQDYDTGAHMGALLGKADAIVAKQSAAAGQQTAPALSAPQSV